MADRGCSRTAIGVALQRALHATLDTPPLLFNDPLAPLLLDPAALAAAAACDSAATRALRFHCCLRSRYAEDRVALATARGVRRVVVLGAGLDTFALRQAAPSSCALSLNEVVEVDHPASARDKRARLLAAGLTLPPNARVVEIDFATSSLVEGLGVSDAPTLFICLGVVMYLDAGAIDALLRFVAAHPHGSELVFSFLNEEPLLPLPLPLPPLQPPASPTGMGGALFAGVPGASLAEQVAGLGEPFLSKHAPAAFTALLLARGFSAAHLLEAGEAQAAYPSSLLPQRWRTSIGHATV